MDISSYLENDPNFLAFSNQLSLIGLEIRDVYGDGNCLFRALSVQIEDNEDQHSFYRSVVCEYMRENRINFEPGLAGLLVDTNEKNNRLTWSLSSNSYENYIQNLEKNGTYGDDACLAAFACFFGFDIIIHQLGLEPTTIHGSNNNQSNQNNVQINISYHNEEHYASVHRITPSTSTPGEVKLFFFVIFEIIYKIYLNFLPIKKRS